MDVKEQLLEIAKKHGIAMAEEMLLVAAFPALEAAVKASATPIDDALLELLEDPLKKAIQDLMGKL